MHRNFALAMVANMVEGIFYYVLNQYIGQQSATVYSSAPLVFGFSFALFFIPQLPAYVFVGWYTKRTTDVKGPLM